jgi:hypothetical protein
VRAIWSGLGGGVVVPVVAVDGEPPFLLVFLFERRAGGDWKGEAVGGFYCEFWSPLLAADLELYESQSKSDTQLGRGIFGLTRSSSLKNGFSTLLPRDVRILFYFLFLFIFLFSQRFE